MNNSFDQAFQDQMSLYNSGFGPSSAQAAQHQMLRQSQMAQNSFGMGQSLLGSLGGPSLADIMGTSPGRLVRIEPQGGDSMTSVIQSLIDQVNSLQEIVLELRSKVEGSDDDPEEEGQEEGADNSKQDDDALWEKEEENHEVVDGNNSTLRMAKMRDRYAALMANKQNRKQK